MLGEGWTYGEYGKTGSGWKFINDKNPNQMISYNQKGVHKSSYYKISGSKTYSKIKLVDSDYIPLKDDKSQIININN